MNAAALRKANANLARAHEVRLARSAVRHKLKNGEITVMQAIEEPCCQTATLYSLLKSQKLWGPAKAMKLLTRMANTFNAPIGTTRKVEDLTERQRRALAAALGERVQ
jgi:AMMECR1 domain-containing protein